MLTFVFHSSLATGVVSLRGALAPLLLGIVSKPVQVGFFRIAQAPMQGLASLSAPARLILLTEQTRDWARGRDGCGLRRRAALHDRRGAADGDRDPAGLRASCRGSSGCCTAPTTQARPTPPGSC